MASINPLDPSTFHLSSQQQSSIYRYIVQVKPKDPATYTGVPYVTVSSTELLSEDTILMLASSYVEAYWKFGGLEAIESLTLTDALIGKNFQ